MLVNHGWIFGGHDTADLLHPNSFSKIYNESTTAVVQVGQVRGHFGVARGVRRGCLPGAFFYDGFWPIFGRLSWYGNSERLSLTRVVAACSMFLR